MDYALLVVSTHIGHSDVNRLGAGIVDDRVDLLVDLVAHGHRAVHVHVAVAVVLIGCPLLKYPEFAIANAGTSLFYIMGRIRLEEGSVPVELERTILAQPVRGRELLLVVIALTSKIEVVWICSSVIRRWSRGRIALFGHTRGSSVSKEGSYRHQPPPRSGSTWL